MKTMMLTILGVLFLNVGFAQHDHSLSNAKLAHDGSHRLGKLVDTGKLDEIFITNLASLEVTPLDHTDPNAAAFKILAVTGSGANQTELTFNMTGKFLANKVIKKGDAESSSWPEAAGSTLIENALHFLMETASLELFSKDLKKAVLSLKTNADGSSLAVVKISASNTVKVLEIELSLAGVILGHSIVE